MSEVQEVIAAAVRAADIGGFGSTVDVDEAAANVLDALRALPVERRMAAMGMVFYGEVEWDDEEERDVIRPVLDDVVPGAAVYVDEALAGEATGNG